MPYRTLGDLRGALLGRLGMGGMGASGGANQAAMDSYLQNAQTQLYWAQDWRPLTWFEEFTTGVDQNQYDYPEACAQDRRVLRIEVKQSGCWSEIYEGITTGMWSTMDTRSVPARYERYAQLLFYPKADTGYQFRVWYVADLQPFIANDDRATIDDQMIFLHALANAKAHYRHPDAALYQGQLDTLLASIRGQSFGSNRVYRRNDAPPSLPKPVVIDRE